MPRSATRVQRAASAAHPAGTDDPAVRRRHLRVGCRAARRHATPGTGPAPARGYSKAEGPGQPGAVPAGHPNPHPLTVGPSAFWSIVVALRDHGRVLARGRLADRRPLRPARCARSSATARDISASNLHRRLGVRGRGDEFTELGQTLDDLFGRLEASFQAQRHFIANASHELRTPLSAGRALLQVALADPEPTVETLRATCEELVELGDQQERLIAALLALASSQRGIGQLECLDLADITQDVLLARQDEAERHGIHLARGTRRGPGDRLTRAWRKAWSPTSSTTPSGTTCPAARQRSPRH